MPKVAISNPQFDFAAPDTTDDFERDGVWKVPFAQLRLRPGIIPTKSMSYPDMVTQKGMENPLPNNGRDLVLVQIAGGSMIFAKNTKPSAELTPSQTFDDQDDWQWPAVMISQPVLGIRHIAPSGNYITTLIDPTNPFVIPQTSALCRVQVKRWWTVDPWPLRMLGGPQPEPGWVRVPALPGGESLNVLCLHRALFITGLTGVTSINGQPITPGSANLRSTSIKATNFETWLPFIYKDGQQLIDGRWFREQRRIFPPDDPYTMPRAQVASSG